MALHCDMESLTLKLDSGFEMYLAKYISKPGLATRCKFIDAPKTLKYLFYRALPSYLPYIYDCKHSIWHLHLRSSSST